MQVELYGESKKTKTARAGKDAQIDLEREELVVLGRTEINYLTDEARRIVTLYGDDAKAIAAELKSLRKNFHALAIGAGIDAGHVRAIRVGRSRCAGRRRRPRRTSVQPVSEMGRFETEWLPNEAKPQSTHRACSPLGRPGACPQPPDRIILDQDSSESPIHGAQEGAAWNRSLRLRLLSSVFRLQPVRGPRVVHAAARQRAQH
ncbi:MAG: Transposase domain group 1 [Geminicoccaceae bacterium]|jgi:hypothetical protein|nr:Transposase domain group 1 [Geminicoccaceae bacterium]